MYYSVHVLFCLLYKHTNNDVFDDLPKISDQFPKISEDFPKLFRRLDERLRTFSEHFPKIAINCRSYSKISEEVPIMFRSYNTTSEYFLSDYVAIAMPILRLVATTWYFYTSKYRIFTRENIWIFSVAEIQTKNWCLYNNCIYLTIQFDLKNKVKEITFARGLTSVLFAFWRTLAFHILLE